MIVYNLIKVIIDGIGWLVGKVGGFLGIGGGGPAWKMPSFQTGGIMPYTGVAYLHKGEKITPAGESSSTTNISPNITINATVSSDYDVRKMATLINQYISREMQRVTKGGTI